MMQHSMTLHDAALVKETHIWFFAILRSFMKFLFPAGMQRPSFLQGLLAQPFFNVKTYACDQ